MTVLTVNQIRVTLDGMDVTRYGVIRAHSDIGYVSLAEKIPGREPGYTEVPNVDQMHSAFGPSRGRISFPLIRHYYYGRVEFSNGFEGEFFGLPG